MRQPTDELLEIVALESQRAGAVVIGEDLGTVPAGVRAELRRRRLLSTRLALFERAARRRRTRARRSPASRPTTCRRSPACGAAPTSPTRPRPASTPDARGAAAAPTPGS